MSIAYSHRVPEEKVKLAKEIEELAKNHRSMLIVDLSGVPAKHIQMLRKKLAKHAIMKVVKPKVALKALENLQRDVEKLKPYMTGQIMLIFSNKNVFELANTVEGFITYDYHSPGDIADKEIVIPEGNTGLPPGPILSVFGRLKIPTKVQGNVVYVAKDTVVAKPGDTISADLASILQKLGLALKEIKVRVKCGFDEDLFIPGDKLKINLAEYEESIKQAALDAFKLAVELVIPEPIVLNYTIVKAQRHALALVAELGFITPDTAEYVIRVAHTKALALALEVSKYAPELGIEVKPAVQPAPEKEEKREEKKEEEESRELGEEALAEGFAALFG
ncbi:MAG: 50S ribosomal protein L10 [Desulfurococcaceae archaeon]